MKSFWLGFSKKANATGGLTGGSGFTGTGKGSLMGQLVYDQHTSTEEGYGRPGPDTRVNKELLDRDRTARDFSPHHLGPELQDESNPHIRY